jgi:hypothetical protein
VGVASHFKSVQQQLYKVPLLAGIGYRKQKKKRENIGKIMFTQSVVS